MEQEPLSPREARCPICLHPLAAAVAAVKGCMHRFCVDCIHKWCSSRPAPRCPLCQAPVTVLVLPSGAEEVVHPFQGPSNDPPDLSCLDGAYFAGEAGRLLSRARAAQLALAREGARRRGPAPADAAAADTLAAVIEQLEQVKHDLQREQRFQPEELLPSLYALDELVKSIAAGNFAAAPPPSAAAVGGGGGRLGAADAEAWAEGRGGCEEDDSDLDYSDEDPDAGLHHSLVRQLGRASLGSGGGRRARPRRSSSGASLARRGSGASLAGGTPGSGGAAGGGTPGGGRRQ